MPPPAWREVDIVIIASGTTEREALPQLLRVSTIKTGRRVAVVFPPNNRPLTSEIASQLIKANYWGLYPRPHKAVVLLDADALAPLDVIDKFRAELIPLVTDITNRGLPILVTAAKWHLEAWFFGDSGGLATFLGRDLGGANQQDPDAIPHPKQHLKNLLDRLYTSRVAGAIAAAVDPDEVRQRSDSFVRFELAVENGPE